MTRFLGRDHWSRIADELRPRLKEARYSLHLMRKSPLAVIGLGIVGAFVFLAIAGPALAPMKFLYNADEKNSPPAARPIVQSVRSALDVSGADWYSSAAGGIVTALQNDDDRYVRSNNSGDALLLQRFEVPIYTELVTFLGVNVQENSTEGSPGSLLDISVSWDDGATWSSPQATWLRFSDVDNAWLMLDFTNATTWSITKVTDLAVRAVHNVDPSFAGGPIGIDSIQVVVRFEGLYHILGTTVDGEDVLTGMLMGAPISMRIGIVVIGVAVLVGALLGAISGYFGGAFDEAIMRITDVFLSIPGLILAVAVAFALGRSLDNVMYALIITFWPAYTRLVRGQALSIRENTYIEAARASGSSEIRVVTRHILPNTLSPIIVNASLDVGSVVLIAAGLSFLGLGAQPGTPEWGLMVSKGFTFFPAPNWWQVTFAGFMIFMFTLGWNLLGDGLRDILDPRLRR